MKGKNAVQQLICSLGAALLLAACAAPEPASKSNAGAATLAWPPPPASARIRYVRSIATAQDMGIKKSFFRRLISRFSGRAKAHFIRPSGVAEHDQVIYVADPGAHSLWILDPLKNRITGVRQVGKTTLLSPVAVAVRSDGAVFVADSALGKVFLLDRQGHFLGVAAQTELQRPAGLAFDNNNGHLYVADSAAQRVLVYNADGDQLFSWGRRGSAAGEFNYPTHLALAQDGKILVTDALNFRVQAFDQEGNFLWQFGRHGDTSGNFASPKGLALDSDQHVYVVDALFDTVQLFNQDGAYLMSFGERGSGDAQFWLPGGLYIGATDRIFVADSYNRRIQEFQFIKPVNPTTPEPGP